MPVPMFGQNPSVNWAYVNLVVTIAATNVAQPLAASSTPCSEVLLQLDPSAANPVFIGGSGVLITTGTELQPPAVGATPDTYQDYVDNLTKVFIVGTMGDKVRVQFRTI